MENANLNGNNNYDEISLRELIMTLWNGKVIIAIVTAAALILSIVYSYFFLDSTYEVNTIFRASTIKVTNSNTSADNPVYIDIDNKIALNTENYAAIFTSSDFLNSLISTLDLRNDDGNLIDPDQIRGKLAVSTNEKKPGIISITVTDTDPEQAYRIAEALRNTLIENINAYVKNNINDYKVSIEYNLSIAKQELDDKREELNKFREEYGYTELLNDEIERLRGRVKSLNDSLTSLEADIEADIASMDVVIGQLREDGATDIGTAEIISEIKQSVGGSSSEYVGGELYLQTNLGMNNSQIANSVRMVELNRLQLRLLNSFNRQQAYTEQLAEIENIYSRKQQDYIELNPRYQAVKNEYDIMASTYNAYVQKKNAAISINTLDIANPHISQVTRPEMPVKPVGPRRMLNIAIGLILGMMLGVFVVFFREYWKNSAR